MTDKYMVEDAQLDPMVTFEIKENWAEYSLRYVVDYKQRRSTKDKIVVLILELVEKSNGEVLLGASPFQVASVPPLDVHLKEA